MNFAERLKTFRDRPNDCWEWPGFCVDGYGKVGANLDARGHRVWFAHRAAYTILIGPVAAELELDHLCRNRRCMNPRHLEPVTPRENSLRSLSPLAANARKTHCIHGHELAGDNVLWRRGKYGLGRLCATCYRDTLARKRRGRRPTVHAATCRHGHAMTPENTMLRRNSRGYECRNCRECGRIKSRETMAAYRSTPNGAAAMKAANRRSYLKHHAERLEKAAIRRASRR